MGIRRYAVAQGNEIINVIMADPTEYETPAGQELVLSEGGGPEIGWVRVGAEWLDPAPGAVPLSFAERQAELIRSVDLLAREKRNAIVADISPAEMASWQIKRAEALAYETSGLDADAPNLSAEAVARDCSLADLVARVLAKSTALSAIEAQISGHTGKLQDQIRAVEEGDSAALAAIDITAGWPA